MSSASPSRVLVKHKYNQGGYLPSKGEIIVVRLSENLAGPGSNTAGTTVQSRAVKHNFHHAAVLETRMFPSERKITFIVCPMPTYSTPDPTSKLSSTKWLLASNGNTSPSRTSRHPLLGKRIRSRRQYNLGIRLKSVDGKTGDLAGWRVWSGGRTWGSKILFVFLICWR